MPHRRMRLFLLTPLIMPIFILLGVCARSPDFHLLFCSSTTLSHYKSLDGEIIVTLQRGEEGINHIECEYIVKSGENAVTHSLGLISESTPVPPIRIVSISEPNFLAIVISDSPCFVPAVFDCETNKWDTPKTRLPESQRHILDSIKRITRDDCIFGGLVEWKSTLRSESAFDR
ncbi:unnamed protein product [Tuwongella immobilis]|uniref:Uncharacterized protein n=1 Tax=Tuwongella immobilis TaxID=692036 RepID=A0A6C2YKK0_9BACT|nr:unnamed protein product [Tuwongella immobilis]VTR99809.1 unnamed protein product [Tuwongella immobilis]